MHNENEFEHLEEVRREAENRAAKAPESLHGMSPEEFLHTVHELKVHQIELEMQNEELREMHKQLDATRARYFDLYDLAPVGYFTVSEKGLILEANLTSVTLLGLTRSTFLKRRISEFILKEDQDIFYRLRKQLFETGTPQRFELRMLKSGGESFWVRLDATNAPGTDGSPVCRMVVSDISERKREEHYREMSREILQILNRQGDLQDVIRCIISTLKMQTGFDAVGIRLKNGDDFPYFVQDGFDSDFLLTENTLVERGTDGRVCRNEDGSLRLECTCGLVLSSRTDPSNPLFTKGGSFWTNNSSALLLLPPGQDPQLHPRNKCIHQGYASVALIPIKTTEGIVGLIQLNDRRKRCFMPETIELLEGLGAHIGDAIMRKLAEAERETLQAQLTQAQKLEAVGRLAGGVAHDFNNMLQIILGHAEIMISKTAPDSPIADSLQEIQKTALRSAALTRQLLAFARKQDIAPEILNLNDAVADIFKMIQRLIGEDIQLVWRPGADLRPVKLDPSQIDQLLANLCLNARDAIAGGGGVITLETGNATIDATYCAEHAEAIPGEYVFLVVSDNGCGMDRETLAHIFEPFFTTKDVGKGTGLGLATVYGIVKQNNGFICAYSEPGHGTTFRIYLPQVEADALQSAVESPAAAPVGQGETILLVEDEPSLRTVCYLFLEDLGYNILTAETSKEALKLAEQHRGDIHLLLTDVVMPEMNGRQLAEKILAVKPDARVLFMSGYTADIVAQHGGLEKDTAFIDKPFTRDELARKIRAVLKFRELAK